jgi:uncharacterized DUF497 family protein
MFDEAFDFEKSEWTKNSRGIDFIVARNVWKDPNAIEGPAATVEGEERWLKVGCIDDKIWTVGFTYRLSKIRIFMIRPARKEEKGAYFDY